MSGLRGCYMPDNAATIRVDTRRELKAYIDGEAGMQEGADVVGLSQAAIAWAAAHAWRNPGGAILPWGYRGQGKPYSIEIAPATRAEYLDYLSSVE